MKKTIKNSAIILWTLGFNLGAGYVLRLIETYCTMNFSTTLQFWGIFLVYFISGVVFALFTIYIENEFIAVISGMILTGILLLLYFFGQHIPGISPDALYSLYLQIHPGRIGITIAFYLVWSLQTQNIKFFNKKRIFIKK